jgi:hypothetical protein
MTIEERCCWHAANLSAGSNAVHSGCTRLGRCQQKLKPFQAFRADDSNTPNTSASDSSARTLADLAGHTNRTSPPPADQQSAVVSQGSSWRASTANTDSVQPLWRKPSFPFVVVIALATLPYDLAYQQYKSRSGGKAAYSPSAPSSRTPASTGHSSSSSSSRSGLSSRPARHAKPQATAEHDQTPLSAPSSNIDVVKREAAAAAAAVGSNHSQQQQQQQQQQSPVGTINHGKASSARKLAAEASQAARAAKSAAAVAKGAASRSSSAAQAAADKQANTAGARSAAANAEAPPASSVSPSWGAAAGSAGPPAAAAAAAVPVDSWDVSDDSAMFSDEDAEQHAKAMVIELLTHPKVGHHTGPREGGPGRVAGMYMASQQRLHEAWPASPMLPWWPACVAVLKHNAALQALNGCCQPAVMRSSSLHCQLWPGLTRL